MAINCKMDQASIQKTIWTVCFLSIVGGKVESPITEMNEIGQQTKKNKTKIIILPSFELNVSMLGERNGYEFRAL